MSAMNDVDELIEQYNLGMIVVKDGETEYAVCAS